jgi:hypothetical protein
VTPNTVTTVPEVQSVEPPVATPKTDLLLSAVPELEPVAEGSPADRVEPCACGGESSAPAWECSRRAVAFHQAGLQHQEWRWRQGITESELRAMWGDR